MKIVFFTDSYLPYQSGVSISLSLFKKYLEKIGHQVFIFAPVYPQNTDKKDDHIFRLFSVAVPHYPSFRLALPFFSKIFKKIQEINPQIIHLYSPFQTGLAGKIIAQRLKIPLLYTFHTLFEEYLHYFPFLPLFLRRQLLLKYLRWFCSGCQSIIVPTSTAKKALLSYAINSQNIVIIPTGIDFEALGNNIEAKTFFPDSQPQKSLIFVGRISKEKNLPFLIKTFKLIIENDKEIFLSIIGNGPAKKKLKRLAAELKINSRVVFIDEIEHDQVFSYLKRAHIFVNASKTETQGLNILEAKALGLPVIAVKEGGVIDIINDGEDGFLVEEKEEVFARKVLDLLNDPVQFRKMSATAWQRTKNFFSMEYLAEKLEQVYEEVTLSHNKP